MFLLLQRKMKVFFFFFLLAQKRVQHAQKQHGSTTPTILGTCKRIWKAKLICFLFSQLISLQHQYSSHFGHFTFVCFRTAGLSSVLIDSIKCSLPQCCGDLSKEEATQILAGFPR